MNWWFVFGPGPELTGSGELAAFFVRLNRCVFLTLTLAPLRSTSAHKLSRCSGASSSQSRENEESLGEA